MRACLLIKERKEKGKGCWIPVNCPVAVEFNTWLNLADGLARVMEELELHGYSIRNIYGVTERGAYDAVGNLLLRLEDVGLDYQFYWTGEPLKVPN